MAAREQDAYFTLSKIAMLMDCVATIAARLPEAEREQVLSTFRERRARIALTWTIRRFHESIYRVCRMPPLKC